MKSKKHQKLYEHYVDVLGEEPIFGMQLKKEVLSDVAEQMKPVTTYVFEPTDELPFWKLCTIGASDYFMPEREIGWGRKANRRNEYMMLIAPEVEVSEDSTEWLFLNSLLWSTAEYAFNEKDNLTVSDTIDKNAENRKMLRFRA
ncbi:MAG: suppressor of fused domain protein [Firmicutes bacterium]|nr:suppressor of fused domain protein [Bacillota bacterium]